VEDTLRAQLTHGDAIVATSGPILRHLLFNDDHTLFNDQVIAHVRGMVANIARQLLNAVAEQNGDQFHDQRANTIAHFLFDDAAFLAHIHSLAVEALVAERLFQRAGIDPVRSPLLQFLSASSDADIAAKAIRALAAQARFMQQQRRMEQSLNELPPGLFDSALGALENYLLRDPATVSAAVANLRETYDPAQRRVQQFASLVSAMEHDATEALEIDRAGLAIFATTLSQANDQSRDTAILSFGEKQAVRLAVELRAAGLDASAVEEQMLVIHPEVALPEGFENLSIEQAAALLVPAQTEAKA